MPGAINFGMEARLTFNVADDLRLAVREEVRRALDEREQESPWMSLASAAAYLDMTQESLRNAQRPKAHREPLLRSHRSATGRLMFLREDLDAFARAGDAA